MHVISSKRKDILLRVVETPTLSPIWMPRGKDGSRWPSAEGKEEMNKGKMENILWKTGMTNICEQRNYLKVKSKQERTEY